MPIRTGIESALAAPHAAAASAPGAVGKATKNASPCVSTSTPSCRAKASRRTAPVLASASAYALGAELVQQPRRALDVGEEEGDGAARQLAHGK